jgi:protein-tyrosine phosphatase
MSEIIDFHTHVLPGIDDGSCNVEESIALLQMEAQQGIRHVIATPHFYANDESVDAFLKRRRASYENLLVQLPPDAPAILLGAEVKYYPGISRLADLKRLRIAGSRLLLLEMPMNTWTESVIQELIELSGKSGIRIVLAHIERYLRLQRSDVWERLREHGILMQTNASFFTTLSTKRKAMALLKGDYIHFLGSDCHNLTSRPPQIGKAFEVIQKKLGVDYIGLMTEYGYSFLGQV